MRVVFSLIQFAALALGLLGPVLSAAESPPRGYSLPLIDLASQRQRQVIVDREPGQYLGHPSTVLLEDGQTLIAVYPKGHGRGALVMKRSNDGGLTWSERLPVPDNWATSKETPTIHRVVDAQGRKRLILWSGLYPARLARSADDGQSWTALAPVGSWGGIVVMGSVVALQQPGHYLAMFHDDGRFFSDRGQAGAFTLYQTFSVDGGLSWSPPEAIFTRDDVHLCEPGVIRSPDNRQLAALLRENSRRRNSFVIFSDDEGQTWSPPRELPGALTGDRHVGKYAPDGRLFVSFRDTTHESPTRGDWVAWVGTFEDLVQGREGQYRVRLMDNHKAADRAYPGVEVLADGTIVTTTYGHWTPAESPYIVSVRLKLSELDELAGAAESALDTTPLPLQLVRAFPRLRFQRPVILAQAGDGSDRLFVGSQLGAIDVLPNRQDATPAQLQTFLDITAQVEYSDQENEEGLLGLAFHPGFRQNHQFFVYYTTRAAPHTSVISRFRLSADNPFVDEPRYARGEIFAYGFRNVWRLSFDRLTGQLWAADVGQDMWEEINLVHPGGNYGWNLREARHRFGPAGSDPRPDLIDPIWEYHHDVGKSIIGGQVYRGSRLPALQGYYLYGRAATVALD